LNLFSTWFQYSNRLSICFQIKYGNRFLKSFFGKSVQSAPHRKQLKIVSARHKNNDKIGQNETKTIVKT
jgi:hypothetical protein